MAKTITKKRAAAFAFFVGAALLLTPTVLEDPFLCGQVESAALQGGRYVVQNNVWGADTPQCIRAAQEGGFTIATAGHSSDTNGKPAAYPSIYVGCHYGRCSRGSGLPMSGQSPEFGSIEASVGVSYIAEGSWNAAFDLWFDPTPRRDGQNRGAEIMVWLGKRGSVHPVGSEAGTVTLEGVTWRVWHGNSGWNIVSYVPESNITDLDLRPATFLADAVARGFARNEWYLTSLQVGFETWVGGEGLAVDSFSYRSK